MCIAIKWMCPGCGHFTGPQTIDRCKYFDRKIHRPAGTCGRHQGLKPMYLDREQSATHYCKTKSCPFNDEYQAESRRVLAELHEEVADLNAAPEDSEMDVDNEEDNGNDDKHDEEKHGEDDQEDKQDEEGEQDEEAGGVSVKVDPSTNASAAPGPRKKNPWLPDEIRLLKQYRAQGKTHEDISELIPTHSMTSIQVKWRRIMEADRESGAVNTASTVRASKRRRVSSI